MEVGGRLRSVLLLLVIILAAKTVISPALNPRWTNHITFNSGCEQYAADQPNIDLGHGGSQDSIPAGECSIIINRYTPQNPGSREQVQNWQSLGNCEISSDVFRGTGFRISNIYKTSYCQAEGIIEIQGSFHNIPMQVCTPAIYEVFYDDKPYFCQGCSTPPGLWAYYFDPSSRGGYYQNPCCSGDTVQTDISVYTANYPIDIINYRTEKVSASCGPLSLDTCPGNNEETRYSCDGTYIGQCHDVYNNGTICSQDPVCGTASVNYYDYDLGQQIIICSDSSCLPRTDVCTGWNTPCLCAYENIQYYHIRDMVNCGGTESDTCDGNNNAQYVCPSGAIKQLCQDIYRDAHGRSWARYVSCRQRKVDDADRYRDFCLNCMTGDNRPDPNEGGSTPRTWNADAFFSTSANYVYEMETLNPGSIITDPVIYAAGRSQMEQRMSQGYYWTGNVWNTARDMRMTFCCGDDNDEDIGSNLGSMMFDFGRGNGQILCWRSDRPHSSYYGSYGSLWSSGTESNYGSTTRNAWYWTDPTNIPNQVISVGQNNDIDLLANNNRWHACTAESFLFSSENTENWNHWQTMGSFGSPILFDPGYTTMLCSNTRYSGNNLAKINPGPRIFECSPMEYRGFYPSLPGFSWGMSANPGDIHHYGKYNEIYSRFTAHDLFQVRDYNHLDVPINFTRIDAMAFVSPEAACTFCGPYLDALVLTVGNLVYVVNRNDVRAYPIGQTNFFDHNTQINVRRIDALSFISGSFGLTSSSSFLGVFFDGSTYRYFRYFGAMNINSVNANPFSTNLLPYCNGHPYPPANQVKSMLFLNELDHGVTYPTLVMQTETQKYIYYDNGTHCMHYMGTGPYAINANRNADKIPASISIVPEATAYINPNFADYFMLPAGTGSTLLFDQETSYIYIQMNPPIICKGSGWELKWDINLDTLDSQPQCSQWTGNYCCGEGDDPFESYLDVNGVCFKGKRYVQGSMIQDPWINRGSEEHHTYQELIVKNEYSWNNLYPKIYSCAIDHDWACDQLNSIYSNLPYNHGQCYPERDTNKPYQGSTNLLRDTSLQSWRRTGGLPYNNHYINAGGDCKTDSTPGCWQLYYNPSSPENTFPARVLTTVTSLKPSTTYHFELWVNYRGFTDDMQEGHLRYRINGAIQSQASYYLYEGYEKYSLIFTTPGNPSQFDFSTNVHTLSFELDNSATTTANTIYLDDPRLRTNDAVSSIKDFPNPHDPSRTVSDYNNARSILGRPDIDPYHLTYCQTISTDGDDLPDYYCGFDEKFHEITEASARETFNYDGSLNQLKMSIRSNDNDGRLRLKYTEWDPSFPLVSQSIQVAGCCRKYQCWNGETCVEPEMTGWPTLYPNTSIEFKEQGKSGFMCINTPEGALWEWVSAKWNWDNTQHGYCPLESQCIVERHGNFSNNNIPWLFSMQEFRQPSSFTPRVNPVCIDDGQYIGDNYCDNGEWTTRTRLIADTLMRYTNNDFTLVCGPYDEVMNLVDIEVSDFNPTAPTRGSQYLACPISPITGRPEDANVERAYFENKNFETNCITRECAYRRHGSASIRDYAMPCVNNACVLRETGGRILMGFSINRPEGLGGEHYPLANLFGLSGSSAQYFCARNNNSDAYGDCSTYLFDIFYNGKVNSVIFSRSNLGSGIFNPTSGPGQDFYSISQRMRDIFWQLHGYSTIAYPHEANVTNKFTHFYYAKQGDNQISGFMVDTGNRPSTIGDWVGPAIYSDIFIEYDGFADSVCNALGNKTYMTIEQSYYSCHIDGNDNIVVSQRFPPNQMAKYWQDLTAKLRVFIR